MNIKIYGTDTKGTQLVTNLMMETLEKAKISYDIHVIREVSQFLAKKIESIPAIQMNDGEILGLKSNGSFNKSLRSAVNKILSTENYGELSKFIIPIDFSHTSMNALSYGHRLATDLDAVTKVTHVYKPKPKLKNNVTVCATTQIEKEKQLEELVKSLDKDWGSDILKASLVSPDFRVGFVTDNILDSIEENAGELVIMGTTGTSNILKRWFGNISLTISSIAPCPVLLVPQKAHYKGISKIMLAIGPEGLDTKTLNQISVINSHFSPKIYIAQVTKDTSKSINLNAIKAQFPALSIISTVIKCDDIAVGLEAYAVTNDIDLITLFPGNRSLFSSFINESVTEEMAINSSIPLLILK